MTSESRGVRVQLMNALMCAAPLGYVEKPSSYRVANE
jgi:hypothetical protein